MAKKQVTFADIAEYTGFSKTTISRYFNHPNSLTLENQEKIAKALMSSATKKTSLPGSCQWKKRICRDHCPEPLSSLLFRNADTASSKLLRLSLQISGFCQ